MISSISNATTIITVTFSTKNNICTVCIGSTITRLIAIRTISKFSLL